LRLPLTQADELLWEAAEQIGQMRAATLCGTLTLLATGLLLFVCCARSRSSSKIALCPNATRLDLNFGGCPQVKAVQPVQILADLANEHATA